MKRESGKSENFGHFLILATLIFIFAHYQMGCSVNDSTAANAVGNSTPTATPGSGSVNIQSNITSFGVTIPSAVNYSAVISKWTAAGTTGSDGVTPCTASRGEDALCILDIDELDLWYRGYTLNDTVPSTGTDGNAFCAYRAFLPYFYAVAPVGTEPTYVVYTVDSNGNIDVNASEAFGPFAAAGGGGAPGTAKDIYYYIKGSWVTHSTLYGQAATAPTDMACPFDYTAASRNIANGKNCCYGNYTKVVEDPASTPSKTVTSQAWGGKRGNCFDGPAKDFALLPVHVDGMPAVYVSNVIDISVTNSGLASSLTVTAPASPADTSKQKRYLYAANYFSTANNGSDVPTAARPVRSYYASSAAQSSAYFLYECLDASYEEVARIRVLVRGWSTDSEFQKFLLGVYTANPDLGGVQSIPTPPAQNSGESNPTNSNGNNIDFCAWDDLRSGGDCDLSSTNAYSAFGFNSGTATATIGIWQDPGGGSKYHYLGFEAPF